MSREYYIYWYRLNNKDIYLIWFSNEKDGFVTNENEFIPGFQSVTKLQSYANKKQIQVDVQNPRLINLDIVQNWFNDVTNEIEDYNPFLDAWNLFDDISNSTNSNFDQDRKLTKNIYNKIFWGCNLPAITPEGKSFTPIWTKKELKVIRETLNLGFQIFREKVKAHK